MKGSISWWKQSVFYQIYLRSFQDDNGDGVGDLCGVERRLPYLRELGIDAIWLSPVHPSPDIDFGYDVADYCAVHPSLGTLEELTALIAAANALELRVVLDGVFNHTSDTHPWFVSSVDEPDGPFGDFYIWRDGRGSGGRRPPNNWGSVFGGPAWRFVPKRGQWVLHSFAAEQPDLNWRCEAVQNAVLSAMEFWLERGVSGFRLDVFNCYLKDLALQDNPRRADAVGWLGAWVYPFIAQQHRFDRDQPELASVLNQMRELVDRYDGVLIGETLDERFVYDNAAQWVGPDRLHLAFHFGLLHSRWSASAFALAISRWSGSLAADGWPTWVVSNHDFQRAATRWGERDDRMRLVALLLTTLRGTPVLYQGDELGLREVRLSRAQIQDPPGRRFWPLYRGRDGSRTPLPWDETVNGGFSEGEPWLPLGEGNLKRSVAAQRNNPDSLWAMWRDALAVRRTSRVLQTGAQGEVSARDGVLMFSRDLEDSRVWVVLNMTDRRREIAEVASGEWRVLLGTHPRDRLVAGRLTLAGCEGVLLESVPPEESGRTA